MPFRVKGRGVWRGQVRKDGKTYWSDHETKREAADWEARKRKELTKKLTQRTGMDCVSFFEQYLDEAKMRFTAKTYQEKKSLCDRITPLFGHLPVDGVTPDMIRGYLNSRAQKVSSNRYNVDRKNLLAMWTWGQKILDLPTNPVAKLRPLPHDRAPQYTPPRKDVLKVLAACNREDRVFLNCYLHTGARRSEIFRWTWTEDVNLETRQIRLGTRKTRDGSMKYRFLPMSDTLFGDLQSWHKNRPVPDSLYVFVVSDEKHPDYGKPYTQRRRFLKGLCKRAGVKEFRFHALRRHVASHLHALGVPLKTIQEILGHAHLLTTERYVYNIGRDLESVVNLLDTEDEKKEKLTNGLTNEI